ncbi:tRNA 5-methoxyuridine(34)/uridine 5-oxyacetic acid(34) synthase CmoB [Woeseia oceani]|uniref:tRNA U34 carboxymethyltransferase n=1 Tax=Woeseia oceani TaxID=1548547 RepID=A0A193LE03_9GAMM|nr:tRNA 5-methoxyuridine(34)/uridine 5-oxyacetic acid(34) synthase CmoB [Woeseia oceani]ANO50614.1 tRNA 5-methoxyuridine(34) synthase CmoB [Woeseia oceani]
MDRQTLCDDLTAAGLADWPALLGPLLDARLNRAAHGDMPAWLDAVRALPPVSPGAVALDTGTVRLLDAELPPAERAQAEAQLRKLMPWRKGPFDIGGLIVDCEWRSDLKWSRVAAAISPLAGRTVLDVGCGNGYYALRMHGAGARCVIGIDPTLLFVMQFQALRHFLPPLPVHVLPLTCEELPASGVFDTVFSMGVLYHRRSPVDHLRELRGQLRQGGELVLETLVLPGDGTYARTPPGRYARMRNVWMLPTVSELTVWLERTGFRAVHCADLSATTPDEQRSTDWMPFESLREALDPDDPSLTVEGWPAPLRATLIARND